MTVKPQALSWRWIVWIEAAGAGAGTGAVGTDSLIAAGTGPWWLAIPRICSVVAAPENQPEMFATGRPRSEMPMSAPESFPCAPLCRPTTIDCCSTGHRWEKLWAHLAGVSSLVSHS